MKSDHRHELKTNELADWLGHLPQWVEENRTTLIAVGVVAIVALGVYFVRFRGRESATTRQHVRLTSLVMQLPDQAERIAAQQADAMSLLPIAQDLNDFAQTATDDTMAAMALVKRGEALRAELHYRVAEVSRDEIARQIASAQDSYRQALERAASVPALAAAAQFGLGLCEEELGNFDKAREIYQQVASTDGYAGTTAQAAAAHRLQTMDDYKTAVVFKPAPVSPPVTTTPDIQIEPDVVIPSVAVPSTPNEAAVVAPDAPAQGAGAAGGTTDTPAPETDPSGQGEEAAGETPATTDVPEANVPAGN